MAYWYKIHEPLVIDKLWPKMIHASIRRGQKLLLSHVSSKIPLIIIYADLVGSTTMSMTLSIDKLVDVIRVFAHEISHVVDSYGGYVLKYAGDAVISFFPGRVNNEDKYLALDTSVECDKSIINIIRETNGIFNKKFGYPELFTKIGIDAGENAIVQYGYDQGSPIDILGYSMNIGSKDNFSYRCKSICTDSSGLTVNTFFVIYSFIATFPPKLLAYASKRSDLVIIPFNILLLSLLALTITKELMSLFNINFAQSPTSDFPLQL